MLSQALRDLIDEARSKMELSHETFKGDISTLRTGKANPSVLDGIVVVAYGDKMRINQLANVSVGSGNTLVISVWDNVNVPEIRKAIMSSNLGLNPIAQSDQILVPMPELTAEHRKRLIATAKSYGERAKINSRNIRRNYINKMREMKKSGDLSEDDLEAASKAVDSVSDALEAKISAEVEQKEKDIGEF